MFTNGEAVTYENRVNAQVIGTGTVYDENKNPIMWLMIATEDGEIIKLRGSDTYKVEAVYNLT